MKKVKIFPVFRNLQVTEKNVNKFLLELSQKGVPVETVKVHATEKFILVEWIEGRLA